MIEMPIDMKFNINIGGDYIDIKQLYLLREFLVDSVSN
jgi:hypothetical protein